MLGAQAVMPSAATARAVAGTATATRPPPLAGRRLPAPACAAPLRRPLQQQHAPAWSRLRGSQRNVRPCPPAASPDESLLLPGQGGPADDGSSAPAAMEEDSSDDEEFDTIAGAVEVVDEDEAEIDLFGESTRGNLHFASTDDDDAAPPASRRRIDDVLGLSNAEDILSMPWAELRARTNDLLGELGVPPSTYPASQPQRALFTNRTLSLRSIQVIGYDMDYTLVTYSVEAWEGKAYEYGLQSLHEMGCPVEGLRFDRSLVIRGLIMDTELGNLVKADRFGFVKRAMHGTRMLTPGEVREAYGRQLINLRNESRYIFLNTLFSVSEAVLYMQMVDRLDADQIPHQVCSNSYAQLHKMVAKALFRAHVEGKLKAEIVQDPAAFVTQDPEMAQTLLDQKQSGKQLLLITNSDYHYTQQMMSYAYDCFLPAGQTWRDLFDMVIVNARKPDFFTSAMSLYEVVTEDGLMRPTYTLRRGGVYCGGSAALVEKALGVEGDSILYVGDHIYTDAALAKMKLNWRTALIVAELEAEIEALAQGRAHRKQLKELLNKKDMVGDVFNQLRLARQRALNEAAVVPLVAQLGPLASVEDEQEVNDTLGQLLMVMGLLDEEIAPMIEADGMHFSRRWGYLSRAGVNDKSQLMRQIEKYADIFTSRVSNLLRYTPFEYFRSPAQLLVHDRPSADGLVLSSGVLDSSEFASSGSYTNGGAAAARGSSSFSGDGADEGSLSHAGEPSASVAAANVRADSRRAAAAEAPGSGARTGGSPKPQQKAVRPPY